MNERIETNHGSKSQRRTSRTRAAPGKPRTVTVHHSHETAGLSLAVKVALMCVLGAAVPVIVVGAVVYNRSSRTLYREVDACGVNLAKALAQPGAQWWDAAHGTLVEAIGQVSRAAEKYPFYLATKFGLHIDATAPADSTKKSLPIRFEDEETRDRLRQEEAAFRAEYDGARDQNVARLRSLTVHESAGSRVPSEILDAYVVEAASARALVRANQEAGAFFVDSVPTRYSATGDGTTLETDAEIVDGHFENLGPARSYSWPIRDAEGRVTHQAVVFLSMARLAGSLGALARQVVLGAVVSLGIIAAAAYASTRWLTRPILVLVDDVDIIRSGQTGHRTRVHTRDEIGILARTVEAMARHEAGPRPHTT